MHRADLQHSNKSLQAKLEKVFQLRRTRSKVNWDREKFIKLLESFGNPHLGLPPVIHVAGTNGKGSVIAMLRSILLQSNLRVHSYTSPHLVHVNERIFLNGRPIGNFQLERLLDTAIKYNDGEPLSFFEITTAVAFKAFSNSKADVLLLEVGMGGRLDCTNVVDKPLATVINTISMDHTEFLGKDIKDIAKAKAGIMKEDVPCIVGYQGSHAEEIYGVIKEEAEKVGAPLYIYGEDWTVRACNDHFVFSFGGKDVAFPLPSLAGKHQIKNAGLALATLYALKGKIDVHHDTIERGLISAEWPGRLQPIPPEVFGLSDTTHIVVDSGHNENAAQNLAEYIKEWKRQKGKNVNLVMGMLKTKNAAAFLHPLLPHISSLGIVPINSDPNSFDKELIEAEIDFEEINTEVFEFNNVSEAVKEVAQKDPVSLILIAGSVYLAGEVLQFLEDYA